jgi:hypothetical protein
MARLTQLWPTATPGRQYNIVAAGAPGVTYFTTDDQPWVYTAANWPSTINFYLEAFLKATSGTVYARLYDDDGAAAIANSVVSTSNVAFTRLESSAISGADDLTDGNTYRFQLGADTGASGTLKGAPCVKAR